MFEFKKYSVTVAKYSYKRYNYQLKNFPTDKIEILLRIDYYDNKQKKAEDIKEYICDIFNYSICPCLLKICTIINSESKSFNKKNFEFYENEDSTLLSKLFLKDSFYILVMSDNKCKCSYNFIQNFKLSKMKLIELLNKYNDKNKNYEYDLKRLKEKEVKIDDLEFKIKWYEKQIEKYVKKLKINKEKESKILNLENKIGESEKTINTLINENNKKSKENSIIKNQLDEKENKIKDLNKQISDISYQSNKKDKIIERIKNENEGQQNNLNYLKEQIKQKNEEIKKISKENNENYENISELNEKVNGLNLQLKSQSEKIDELKAKEINEKTNNKNLEKKFKESSEILEGIKKERDNYKNDLNKTISEKEILSKNFKWKKKMKKI